MTGIALLTSWDKLATSFRLRESLYVVSFLVCRLCEMLCSNFRSKFDVGRQARTQDKPGVDCVLQT